mmetsp:Transcript_66343/g.209727  ORF Transcript_66343/g.209727 Transcript_66343/m.209727 type:complete len:787 (+) Transcript_66343:58-2418(+)
MPYRSGEKVGEYEVSELLGRGAHGVVLKVRRPGSSIPLALKVLPCDGPSLSGKGTCEKSRDAAFAEARLLQRLRYPHIVECHDVFWDAEQQAVHLVLEYMDGGDLHGLIEARRASGEHFEAHFARRLIAAVGGALAYIHSAGVLHRDVKPANVLLTRHSQRIKLADFGIAKLLEQTAKANTVVGTPYYLSPEIVSGQAYGEAADCWAFGVCLYEVATLQRPFNASNQLALVRCICENAHQPLPDHVAPDVQRAVEGLLAKDFKERMPLCGLLAVSEAVAALVAGTCTSPTGASRAEPVEEAISEAPAKPAKPAKPALDSLGDTSNSDASLWQELQASWSGSEAAAAARRALGGDVDDPEELVQALAALERERDTAHEATTASDIPSSGALDALESELRLRISALRHDAAAMLDDLLATGEGMEITGGSPGGRAAPASEGERSEDENSGGSCSSRCSSPRLAVGPRAADVLEQALEVATSLGVETEASEERVAHKRGMLSLRVKWGGVARFCMLPINVGYDSLVAEISRRFGLALGVSLPPLSWREAGETFELTNQACWEECQQRRGLVAQPGRLELCVQSDGPPPVPTTNRMRSTRSAHWMAGAPSPVAHRHELFTWRISDRPLARMTAARHYTPMGRTASRLCDAGLLPGDECTATARTMTAFRATHSRGQAEEVREAWAGGDAAGFRGAAPYGPSRTRGPESRAGGEALPPVAGREGSATASKGQGRGRPLVQVRWRAAGDGRDQSLSSPRNARPASGSKVQVQEPVAAAGPLLQVNGRAVPLQ